MPLQMLSVSANIFSIFQNCQYAHLLIHDLSMVSPSMALSVASPLIILFLSKVSIYSVYSNPSSASVNALYFMFEELQYGGSNNHKFIIRTSQISHWYLTLIFNFNTGRELRWWWSWQLETFNILTKVLATFLWKKHVLKDMLLERVSMVLKVQSR